MYANNIMKIQYEIKELRHNIFTVVVPDGYHRAMLFLRCQEFYESPNDEFRGKDFSIWDFIEWYSRDHNDKFTYAYDWCGFNIPFETMVSCIEGCKWLESPYDTQMEIILSEIDNMRDKTLKSYVIGVDTTNSSTYTHELCHGLYYINDEYKQIADELTQSLNRTDYNGFKKILLDMGYTDSVIDDEIQAFIMTNFGHFKKATNNIKELHEKYQAKLKRFL